jgi:hypothetical protein
VWDLDAIVWEADAATFQFRFVSNQAERILRDLDVVKREEFEAVKEMARLAREENEALKARLTALEGKLGAAGPGGPVPGSTGS